MRIVIICHPLTQSRSIVFEEKITDVAVNEYNIERVGSSDRNLKTTFKLLSSISLVDEISIHKYTVNIKIVDGFHNCDTDWQRIQYDVIDYIYQHLDKDYSKFSPDKVIFDDRRFENTFKTLKIPHDFETHRAAWRGAILDKVNILSDQTYPDPDGQLLYWQNELEKFDAAFDALLALKLPTDA